MTQRQPRIGIALGAGSARGWAHIGVLQALQEQGIVPDLVCGTSIGALVGAAYADDRLTELESWVGSLTWRKVVGFLDVGFSSGLVKGNRLFTFLKGDLLDKRVEELKRPYAAVATDLATGREIWLREGPVADAVRASIAMPGLFTPWSDDERLLVDGALVNPVPVSLARAMDADFVIAVDLNANLVGRYARASKNGVPLKRPGMIDVLTSSLNIMSERITRSRLAGEPAEVVIQPRLAEMGLMEYHRGSEAIAEGRAAADIMIPHIKRMLDEA